MTTSVKSITTSLPTVIAAITFFTASFFFSIFGLASSSLSSWISPARKRAGRAHTRFGKISRREFARSDAATPRAHPFSSSGSTWSHCPRPTCRQSWAALCSWRSAVRAALRKKRGGRRPRRRERRHALVQRRAEPRAQQQCTPPPTLSAALRRLHGEVGRAGKRQNRIIARAAAHLAAACRQPHEAHVYKCNSCMFACNPEIPSELCPFLARVDLEP